MTNKNIEIPILARVEGEGALSLSIKNNKIDNLQLKIYEPPRLFEQFLIGREPNDVIDLVARICGICPVAYQMSAVRGLEQCFDMQVTPWVEKMRRVFYCGEWLASHSIHIHLLALPDFFGFNTAPEMAKQHPEPIRRGLRLQALADDLVSLFGARLVHPVGACVGGFYKAPSQQAVNNVIEKLRSGLEDAVALIDYCAQLDFADHTHDFLWVALDHPDDYPMHQGNIKISDGRIIEPSEFSHYFKEFQVPYSTALHCTYQNKPYLVGPLARMNLNYEKLPGFIQTILDKHHIRFPSQNMFHSIVARAVECCFAIYEALNLLGEYQRPDQSAIEYTPRAGEGFGATEAPRGLLWHHYRTHDDGLIEHAQIVPPTSQNQAQMEAELISGLTRFGLEKDDTDLRFFAEKLIRNYDPCISCSTHFLDLRVNRND